MKKLTLVFTFISSFSPLLAQQTKEKISVVFIVKSTTGDKETVTRNLVMNSSNIADLEIMKTEEVSKRFGNSEKLAVFVVTPKSNAKLIPIKDFYNNKKLSVSKRSLPLTIDGISVASASDVIIDESSINTFDPRADSIVLRTSNYEEFLKKRKVRDN